MLSARALKHRLLSKLDNGQILLTDVSQPSKALTLYGSLNIDVNILEQTSQEALLRLLKQNKRFHLVYVDGLHSGLTPTLDFGLAVHLVHDNGIVMIDDHVWPDITALKDLCDRHCQKIYECWKVAAYKIHRRRSAVDIIPEIQPNRCGESKVI